MQIDVNDVPDDFISENINLNVHDISKKLEKLDAESRLQLIQQIAGRQKIRKKLPLFFTNHKLIIPPTINLEQSSSEATANFKAALFEGKKIVDITGGLGIDSFAFASKNKVIHCELNPELAKISETNAQILQLSTIEILACDGIDYVHKSSSNFDLIYLDPARRSNSNKKLIKFEDCTPNILAIKDDLFEKTDQILMKTSPMFDISLGLHQLKNVSKVWVVAVKNEVKEILWLLTKNVSLASEETPIYTININKLGDEEFDGNYYEEKHSIANKGIVKQFLYEPNASILKAGFFNLISTKFKLDKLATNSHLYSSDALISNFPGRIFEVKEVLPYKTNLLKKRLLKKKINISTRNFSSLVRDLISKFKIVEGGEEFVFFTQQNETEKIVIFTKKVSA